MKWILILVVMLAAVAFAYQQHQKMDEMAASLAACETKLEGLAAEVERLKVPPASAPVPVSRDAHRPPPPAATGTPAPSWMWNQKDSPLDKKPSLGEPKGR